MSFVRCCHTEKMLHSRVKLLILWVTLSACSGLLALSRWTRDALTFDPVPALLVSVDSGPHLVARGGGNLEWSSFTFLVSVTYEVAGRIYQAKNVEVPIPLMPHNDGTIKG